MRRFAKIVATIGPACQDEATLERLIQAGIDVARLNFSHGSHENHAQNFKCIRQLSQKLNHPVAILQDLQGPKIRIGTLQTGAVELAAGQPLQLTTRPVPGDTQIVPVDFPELIQSAQPGGKILLDDGNLELKVLKVLEDTVETEVVIGGLLKSHKGVNLPGARISIPGFTEKDRSDLMFGLELGVDLVAVSFVRTAEDIRLVREAIASYPADRSYLPVIAKLERPEALDNLDEILAVVDGVMVARGDLGVELSPQEVPIAQKRIIQAANRLGKVVITATQMLDSMIQNPRPTRAEASDVANAVFDGTDALMLSGETASGKYPVQAVEMMDAIICQAETHTNDWGRCQLPETPLTGDDDAYYLTTAARELAHDRNVAAIAVFTRTGKSACLMSKARPIVQILAFTPEIEAYHRMGIYWGVRPYLTPHVDTIEEMLETVERTLVSSTPVQPGQQIVLVCGFPVRDIRPPNLTLIHTVKAQN